MVLSHPKTRFPVIRGNPYSMVPLENTKPDFHDAALKIAFLGWTILLKDS